MEDYDHITEKYFGKLCMVLSTCYDDSGYLHCVRDYVMFLKFVEGLFPGSVALLILSANGISVSPSHLKGEAISFLCHFSIFRDTC